MPDLYSPLSENLLKKVLSVKDYLVSQEDFDLYYDEDWDMMLTYPVPKDLAPYYQSENYKPHQPKKKTVFDYVYRFIRQRNYAYKRNLIKAFHPKAQSVLDYGTATGEFLAYLSQNTFEVSGVEPNNKARQYANKLLENNVRVSIDEIDKKFDVITLWHVLEHIKNLEELVVKLRQHLKPDGIILVAVPNFKSYDARYYKKYWAAYDVPRHLWHFSPLAIEKLFYKHGLTVLAQKPLFFDSFYVSLLSEQYKTGHKRLLPAFWTGLKSNIKARRSGQYSSLIYVIGR